MLSALLITLREGFEAALLIGILLAAVRRGGGSSRSIWVGAAAAAGVSLIAGAALFASGRELTGTSEQLFEAGAALIAAGFLTWMLFWMRDHAAGSASRLSERAGAALATGGAALAWLAFAAVVREGFETALFLFAAPGEGGFAAVLGALAGLAVATALGVAVYRGASRLDLGLFFKITGALLVVFAAYLLFGAVGELGEIFGGEAFEVLGPLVAVVYVAIAGWLYLRPRRPAQRSDDLPPRHHVLPAARL